MSNTLFHSLCAGICQQDESVQFTIKREADGSIKVIALPLLKAMNEDQIGKLSEDQQTVRAAMSRPLVITGEVDEIDAVLSDHIHQLAQSRQAVSSTLGDLTETLGEAQKVAARSQTNQKKDTKAQPETKANASTDAKADNSEPAEKAESAVTSNPDSLL